MTFPEIALPLARSWGLPVFPLATNAKQPSRGFTNFSERATTDPRQIAEWGERYANGNVGIVMGKAVAPGRYLHGLDVDHSLAETMLRECGEFARVLTRRGSHSIATVDRPLRGHGFRMGGVPTEIQGVGEYLVGVGSRVDGVTYQWEKEPTEIPHMAADRFLFWAWVVAGITWLDRNGGLPVRAPRAGRPGERQVTLPRLLGFLHGEGEDCRIHLEAVAFLNQLPWVFEKHLTDAEIESCTRRICQLPQDRREPEEGGVLSRLFVSAGEFVSAGPSQVDWISEPLVAPSFLTLFAGYPKDGKSWLLGNQIKAVLAGSPFLGLPTKPPPLIALVSEEGAILALRLRALGLRNDPRFVINRTLLTWEQVIAALKAVPSGSWVIVDTASRFWPVDNENDNAQVDGAMRPVIEAVRERTIAVTLVHHLGKASIGESELLRFIRGASALVGAADIIAGILRRRDHRTLKTAGRLPERAIDYRPQDRVTYEPIPLTNGNGVEDDPAGEWAEILGAIRTEPGLTPQEIADQTGIALGTVRNHLTTLAKAGKVRRERKGSSRDPFRYFPA